MKFGVLQFFSWKNRRQTPTDVYTTSLERIVKMDRVGYDAVWLAEHHFNDYSICPSIHMIGAWVAAQTQTLRIGTGVSLAAFYHPLRLAEEVALLDVISGGRVNWGAGRGFDKKEFKTFGVPFDESRARFRESVDIVLKAWTEDRLTYRGDYHTYEDVEVLPKPAQTPHPPVWLAATSPDSIENAAKDGFSILMDPHTTHAEISEKFKFYQDTLRKHGHTPEGRDTPVARLLAVANTEDEATEIARKGAGWTLGSYVNKDKSAGPNSITMGERDETEDPIDRYVNGAVIKGTPESVIDQIRELEETVPLNYLMCAPLSAGSFDLFTDKVMPKFM
jgi:alkanesulfonate monooxygenase SsuD/methylene tetrahydromethanopterin reductase-like flavin-dependent oxidoreductase (luciferase family)